MSSFPTIEAFLSQLHELHWGTSRLHSRPFLPGHLLDFISQHLGRLYEREFLRGQIKSNPRATFEAFLGTSFQAVNAFRDALPPFWPQGQSLLSITKTINLTVAYASFGEVFRTNIDKLRQVGLIDDAKLFPPFKGEFEAMPRFYEDEPIYGDQFQRRAWRVRKREFDQTVIPRWKEEKKRYDKAKAEFLKQQTQIDTSLAGTPFYSTSYLFPKDYQYQAPFTIEPRRWFEGTWVVAPQGRGKSNLLRTLILDKLSDACLIIMDAKGDLLRSFERHSPIKDRLVLLEPNSDHPLAINPLAIGGHSGEFLEYIFHVLNTGMTTNHATLMSLVLTLCAKIPDANLETFRDILQNGWKPYDQYVRKLKKFDQDFFDKEWESTVYKPRRPEVLGRLRALLKTPAFDEIFQSKITKLDMGELMDQGKVVLINNNYEKLGNAGAEFFGRIFIALVWAAARRRSLRKDKGCPVYFFIDEAHWTIRNDTNVANIVQQCRSQKVAMIFAHQGTDQIKNDEVKAALNDCAIKFAKPNAVDETTWFAKNMRTTTEFLDSQTKETFALYVLEDTPNAISVTVPLVADEDGALFGYPRMTDEELDQIRRRTREEYCYVLIPEPETLETPEPASEPETKEEPKAGAPKTKRPKSSPTDDETDAKPW